MEFESDRIVVDREIETYSAPKRTGGWLWLGLGFGLGLGVASLFAGSAGTTPDSIPTGGVPPTTVAAAPIGVGGVIPGFPDGLNVLVSPGQGRALEVLTWPLEGEAAYRSIALGDLDLSGTPEFDSSGHFLAAMTSTPDGNSLHAGRTNNFSIVASHITGFAWHDSDAGHLAWSTVSDEGLSVWTSDVGSNADIVLEGVADGQLLSAIGDWGTAVQLFGEPSTVVFDEDGNPLATVSGWVIASHNSGLLLVQDVGSVRVIRVNKTLRVTETVAALDLAYLEQGVLVGGEFSPDGSLLALTGFTGVAVYEVGSDREPNVFSIRAGSESVRWSSDGAFFLVSGFRGVAVADYATGELSSILEGDTTRAVAPIPIGSGGTDT